MKLKAIAIPFLAFLFLFASGYVLSIHGGAGKDKHDLSIFPEYKYGPADKVWNEIMGGIARAEAEYIQAVLHRRGRDLSEHKERMTQFRDEAIYWHAVAKVLIYHSDFNAARQAGKKAEALLRQMTGLVAGERT